MFIFFSKPMWERTYSKIYPDIKKEDIWNLWLDVNNWHKWDPDIEWAKMDEPFAVGSKFTMKPKGGPIVKMSFVEVEPMRKFTDFHQFFGAKMWGTHEIEETSEGLKISVTIKLSGPLKWLWIKLVAQGIVDTNPEQMDALVACARCTHD